MVDESAPQKLRGQRTNVGQKYFGLIDQSDLSEDEKHNARLALEEAIQEVHRGEIAGLRMKIRGIHAEAFGGQDGGRKIQIEKKVSHLSGYEETNSSGMCSSILSNQLKESSTQQFIP